MLSASRSPIFSHFNETQSGVTSIRSYRVADVFKETMEHNIDESSTFVYSNISIDVWLSLRLDLVCSFFKTHIEASAT